jgi:acyl-coenzyme A thioesterase PaaI-like protein
MRYVSTNPAALLQVMEGVDWLREEDGTISPVAGAIVADSTLGSAWACTLPRGTPSVTVRLSLDFVVHAPAGDGPLWAEPSAVHGAGDVSGLVTGVVAGWDRTVRALATLRAARIGGPSPLARPQAARPVIPRPQGPVDRALDLQVSQRGGGLVEATWRPSPWFANVAGALHGGITMVAGGTLLRRALPVAAASLLHIDVAYLRPLPTDGTRLSATAHVTSSGRRYATLGGPLMDGRGRPGALITASYGLR